MSCYSFQTSMNRCPAPSYQLIRDPQVVHQALILHKIRNNMRNNQPGIVLGMHFVTAGEEKSLNTRLLRRVAPW